MTTKQIILTIFTLYELPFLGNYDVINPYI